MSKMKTLNGYEITDPTVPEWAKQDTKPSYTADEVGAIANPQTAEVGQTLVVTEVDENGKPTKWNMTYNFEKRGPKIIFDTGVITLPAETAEVDTGLSLNDLLEYDHIFFAAQVKAEPWTKIAVNLTCKNVNNTLDASLLNNIGTTYISMFYLKRLIPKENYFEAITMTADTGTFNAILPNGTNNAPFAKCAFSIASDTMRGDFENAPQYNIDANSNIRFRFGSATTEEMTLRFTVVGITERGA